MTTNLKAGINNTNNIKKEGNNMSNVFNEVVDENVEYVQNIFNNIVNDDNIFNTTQVMDDISKSMNVVFQQLYKIIPYNDENLVKMFMTYLIPQDQERFENDINTLISIYRDIDNSSKLDEEKITKMIFELMDRGIDGIDYDNFNDYTLIEILDQSLKSYTFKEVYRQIINITHENNNIIKPILYGLVECGFLDTNKIFIDKLLNLAEKYYNMQPIQTQLDKFVSDLNNIDSLIEERSKTINPYSTTFKDFFEGLNNRIEDEQKGRISLVQTRYSINRDNQALQILGDDINPHLVISPIGNGKVKIESFRGIMYDNNMRYPEINMKLETGLAVMIDDFMKYGNGYGLYLHDNGTLEVS